MTDVTRCSRRLPPGRPGPGSRSRRRRPTSIIIVQSTTSTEASGLFGHILPIFQEASGIEARVVAVGTGQALKNAQNCDGDVLLVHAKAAEEKFVAAGYGVDRRDVMYNDFVIVGPNSDPAGIGGGQDAAAALQQIAASEAPFASRGDDFGTHQKELEPVAEGRRRREPRRAAAGIARRAPAWAPR